MKNKHRRTGRPVTGVSLDADARKKMRGWREARGLTRAALAALVGVSVGTLRAWESGARRVQAAALARWAGAVGADPASVTPGLLK